jgi:hypothetical protein
MIISPMITGLMLISGMLMAAGLCCLVVAFARPTPRLAAALERIAAGDTDPQTMRDIGPARSRSERVGGWLYRVVPIPLSDGSVVRCDCKTSRSQSSTRTRP